MQWMYRNSHLTVSAILDIIMLRKGGEYYALYPTYF